MKKQVIALSVLVFCTQVSWAEPAERWSSSKANSWYQEKGWLVGCNFIPSTAVNQLEMWQRETFDPKTIDRELGWAAKYGLNTVRVYLHNLAWQADPKGFKTRIRQYLALADSHSIKTVFVIFDDCWNPNPKIGKQPAPIPGVHNSRWLQSPGVSVVNDPGAWARLERYLSDIMTSFAQDKRILFWDLYNEPGNSRQGEKSLPLLKMAFSWARKVNPSQPLTVGVWSGNKALNDFQISSSDIITFHNYGGINSLRNQITNLKKHGRPVICTEWLRRPTSVFSTHLPLFRKENIGCYNWGLVSGRIQTVYPWGSKKGSPEPKVWFHDLLRKDGTPFDAAEIELIKKLKNE